MTGGRIFSMRKTAGFLIVASLLLAWSLVPARAELLQRHKTGMQDTAALFIQSCMAYTGNAEGLRRWANDHHLPEIPKNIVAVLSSNQPAVFYNASTRSYKLILVSEDSGYCRVIAMEGDGPYMEQALLNWLKAMKINASVAQESTRPDDLAWQHIYHASGDNRYWMLSITTHSHPDAPDMLPEVILLATPDQAPQSQSKP